MDTTHIRFLYDVTSGIWPVGVRDDTGVERVEVYWGNKLENAMAGNFLSTENLRVLLKKENEQIKAENARLREELSKAKAKAETDDKSTIHFDNISWSTMAKCVNLCVDDNKKSKVDNIFGFPVVYLGDDVKAMPLEDNKRVAELETELRILRDALNRLMVDGKL